METSARRAKIHPHFPCSVRVYSVHIEIEEPLGFFFCLEKNLLLSAVRTHNPVFWFNTSVRCFCFVWFCVVTGENFMPLVDYRSIFDNASFSIRIKFMKILRVVEVLQHPFYCFNNQLMELSLI